MRTKGLCAFILVLALCAGMLCHAQSYGSAASRINFYYQHDGGERNQPGTWDRLLQDRLLAISGHSTIYYNASTDKYLTGRGCCLFAFSHAYQYLLGYASSAAKKADILYKFLSIKPVWSNTKSSMSPPNAHSYYASYLAKQSGVTKYTGSLDTFAKLKSFFEGGKGVVIVNAPGHYIIAVGARKYGGTEYVQVVDSILSATVRTGRLSYGKSMDFSVTYTPDNASSYEEMVHEYWVPYSEFKSKCTLRHAFTAGSAPRENRFTLKKDKIILAEGQTDELLLEGAADLVSFESADSGVCAVDALGRLSYVSEGQTVVKVYSPDNPQNVAYADVYCLNLPKGTFIIAEAGDAESNPFKSLPLPEGAVVALASDLPAESGVYPVIYAVVDPYGDTAAEIEVTLAAVNGDRLLVLPSGVRTVEAGAFEGATFEAIILSQTVTKIEEGAFRDSGIRYVFAACEESAIQSGAFPEGAEIFYEREAVENYLPKR